MLILSDKGKGGYPITVNQMMCGVLPTEAVQPEIASD